jgi:predicted O-methyltransferase YrrM
MASPGPLAGFSLTKPVRQLFMMGTVWRLAQDRPDTRLKLLEVGSWNGGSALTWGEALRLHCPEGGHITCIDTWDEYFDLAANPGVGYENMNRMLADGSVYRAFLANMTLMPHGVEIDVRRGRSQDILPTLSPGSFDLVYLDGDHTYEAMRSDLTDAMPLIAEGGILCGDDLEMQAFEIETRPSEVDPHMDFIKPTARTAGYHPGVTFAVDEALGPVSAWAGFWAMQKNGAAWNHVDLAEMPVEIPPHLSETDILELREFLLEASRSRAERDTP